MRTSIRDLIESNPICMSGIEPDGSRCFVKLTLRQENSTIHENLLFPQSFKKVIGLQNCTVQVGSFLSYSFDDRVLYSYLFSHSICFIQTHVDSCTRKDCIIYVRTNSICLFVWLEATDIEGRFSDNGFTMTDSLYTIHFYSKKQISSDQLQQSLKVTWLDKKKIDTFSFAADVSSVFYLVYGSTSNLLAQLT